MPSSFFSFLSFIFSFLLILLTGGQTIILEMVWKIILNDRQNMDLDGTDCEIRKFNNVYPCEITGRIQDFRFYNTNMN